MTFDKMCAIDYIHPDQLTCNPQFKEMRIKGYTVHSWGGEWWGAEEKTKSACSYTSKRE